MSSISLLLRRAFSSSSAISSVTKISKVVYKEADVKKVAEAFKKHTQNSSFRKKTNFYEHTVQRLANTKSFSLIEEILEDQKQYKDITDEGFTVRLITLYGKSGMFDHAHKLFDEMPELSCKRTVLSYNALLGACVNSKKFDKVDGFFRELPGKLSIKPDVVSYNTVIKAFCEMGSLDSALLLLDEMEKEGLRPDLITFNILLDAVYRKLRFLEGEKLWSMMDKYNVVPDIISYNSRLRGLVLEEKMQDAVDFVQEMLSKGLKLDVYTYNILFSGFCKDGKYLEEAIKWFDEMMKNKCPPDRLTFSTLLRYACRNKDFRFGSRLCRLLYYRRCRLNERGLIQKVIDGLVRQSNISEAEILVKLGKDSRYSCYNSLKMPKFDT
ncbi:pentatricopeptide repeat-containing protein At3g13160, mitochondrial-like [Chenopodium quinoa]|uniref:Pentatricopeptide repeat-containing protein n=2 Tax=Chenopodium quinoa TaxID=63459 RepID=A0A803LKZ2_CHEQI|nr:pentatricopeptide repeat-containing protein At3g13160, mitochondrial-like [Chenopodium quinoa]